MRKLEKEIKTNGTIYSLVKRNDWKAMYRAEAGWFEIFKIKIKPPVELFGNQLPEREHYPNNEEFGKFAWCINDETRANELYDRLIKPKKS